MWAIRQPQSCPLAAWASEWDLTPIQQAVLPAAGAIRLAAHAVGQAVSCVEVEGMGAVAERDPIDEFSITGSAEVACDPHQHRRIGYQVGIPAEDQQAARLENGGTGSDCRFLSFHVVDAESEHTTQQDGIEHRWVEMGCRLLDGGDDVTSRGTPSH